MMPSPGLAGQPPFRSALQVAELNATVSGAMPTWLQGHLVRTAPAVFTTANWQAEHWFDGLGLLFGFTLRAGEVTFRQRQLGSASAAAPEKSGGFATKNKRSLLYRLFHPTGKPLSDNTNVNVLPFGDDLVALTETSRQWVIDPQTLEAKRYLEWSDELDGMISLAHPHLDFERGLVVNVGTRFGRTSSLTVFEHAADGRTRRALAEVPTQRVPYTHSFGLTPKHAVLVAQPFDVSSLSMLFSNKGYIDHFRWRPEEGTRFIVIDRATGATREHRSKAFFVFHTVNTYEDGDTTVIDLIAYDDHAIVQRLSAASISKGFPDLRSRLVRARLTRGVDTVELTPLTDTAFELPAIHYRRYSGQPHQHVWGASLWSDSHGIGSRVVKVDARTGASTFYEDADYVFGEPLFVAKPGASAEDEGVLLTVGSHRKEDRACVQVLDASSLGPVARAEVSVPLPLGFHGSFLRAG